MWNVGDRVRVQVGGQSSRGTVVALTTTPCGLCVTVEFWHMGRKERIGYFADDGALTRA